MLRRFLDATDPADMPEAIDSLPPELLFLALVSVPVPLALQLVLLKRPEGAPCWPCVAPAPAGPPLKRMAVPKPSK